MNDEDYMPKKGRPKLGWFVYSSSGCGEGSEIRIAYVDWNEEVDSHHFSPEQAESFANLILEVVKEYRDGKEIYDSFEHYQ